MAQKDQIIVLHPGAEGQKGASETKKFPSFCVVKDKMTQESQRNVLHPGAEGQNGAR